MIDVDVLCHELKIRGKFAVTFPLYGGLNLFVKDSRDAVLIRMKGFVVIDGVKIEIVLVEPPVESPPQRTGTVLAEASYGGHKLVVVDSAYGTGKWANWHILRLVEIDGDWSWVRARNVVKVYAEKIVDARCRGKRSHYHAVASRLISRMNLMTGQENVGGE